MFFENDRVVTLVEKDGYCIGTLGIVVSKYAGGDVYEVELWDGNNYPVDVITYAAAEIKKVE